MENDEGIIKPTVGRKVWYWPYAPREGDQPFDATICYVHSDRSVNLRVTDVQGASRGLICVTLCQPADPRPEQRYCEWMPYQKGQAAKSEPHITIRNAFDTIKLAVQADRDYAWAWHCNLVTELHAYKRDGESAGVLTHLEANQAAARIMQHMFGVDVTRSKEWATTFPGLTTGRGEKPHDFPLTND
jgi:hypothetical protein